MNRQKVFLEMMETLIGKPINFEDLICQTKDVLEENCAKLSSEVGNPFEVNLDEAKEPCPFCCSSIDKPFDLVWVGLNPGGPLDACNGLFSWQNTTWQELVDFCVPTSDIRENEKNIYHYLKRGKEKDDGTEGNPVGSDYYQFFLRFHLALATSEIYNKWGELKNNHADVEKFFVDHFAKYSILNADLVPYKSNKTTFNAEKLLDDKSYGNYFSKLINFIEEETNPDAWIIFYGKTGYSKNERAFGTRDLLEKFAPHWNVPKKGDFFPITVTTKSSKKSQPRYFYTFSHGQRKILLSPFLSGSSPSSIASQLEVLINKMKELENK